MRQRNHVAERRAGSGPTRRPGSRARRQSPGRAQCPRSATHGPNAQPRGFGTQAKNDFLGDPPRPRADSSASVLPTASRGMGNKQAVTACCFWNDDALIVVSMIRKSHAASDAVQIQWQTGSRAGHHRASGKRQTNTNSRAQVFRGRSVLTRLTTSLTIAKSRRRPPLSASRPTPRSRHPDAGRSGGSEIRACGIIAADAQKLGSCRRDRRRVSMLAVPRFLPAQITAAC